MPANRVYAQPATMARRAIERTYRPRNFGAHWFGRALPRTTGGAPTDIASVHWYGDSLAVGDDASSVFGQAPAAANSTAQKDAWRADGSVGVLRRGLQDKWGDSGEGFQPQGLAVTTGTWSNRIGLGMAASRASAAASMTWKVRGTQIVIYWRGDGLPAGTNQLRYQVDGGAFSSAITTSGPNPGRTIVGPLSDGEHTIRVEWVAGTIELNGVRGERAAAGVRVDRFAQHGAAATDFATGGRASRYMSVTAATGSPNITAGTGGYFTPADVGSRITGTNMGTFGAYIGSVTGATTATLADANGVAVNGGASATAACLIESRSADTLQGAQAAPQGIIGNIFAPGVGLADLVIVSLGANDAAAGFRLNRVLFEDAIGKLVSAYCPAGDGLVEGCDFVFVIQHIGKWFNVEARYAQIASWIRDLAEGMNAAVIDMWDAGRRNYSYPQAAPDRYWSGAAADNQIHTSKGGQEMLGNALLDLLRQ